MSWISINISGISVDCRGDNSEFTTVILLSDEMIPAKSNTFFSPSSKLYEMKPMNQNVNITTNVYTCGFHPWLFTQIEWELVFKKIDAPYSHICA